MKAVTLLAITVIEIQLWKSGFILVGSVSTFKLISREDCVCVGDVITYECSVIGGESTVFKGSDFKCSSNNEIILLHSRFPQINGSDAGFNTTCNNGTVLAQSVKFEDGTYTSRLHITLTNELYGKNITCIYDNGTDEITVGNESVQMFNEETTLPPPKDITWKLISTNMVFFMWRPVLSSCSKVKYNIVHSNCGSCPTTTAYTNITCTYTTSSTLLHCMLAVQPVVCGYISDDWSSRITLELRAKGTFLNTAIAVASAAVPVSVILVGISVAIFVIMKRKLMQKMVTTSRALENNQSKESYSEINHKPKPRFHCVPTGSETLGYSLCQSDYDEITVSNNDYSHLDYYNIPKQPALKEPDALLEEEDDDINRQSVVTGCVRLEDEYLDLETLLTKLHGKVQSQWYHLGLAIGVPNKTLDQLCDYSADDCLVEVLDYWLKNHPDRPTWKELADAVADLQDYELASSILKVYSEKSRETTKDLF